MIVTVFRSRLMPGLQDEYVAKELSRRQMVEAVMLGSVGAWLGATGLLGCSSAAGLSGPTRRRWSGTTAATP